MLVIFLRGYIWWHIVRITLYVNCGFRVVYKNTHVTFRRLENSVVKEFVKN